MADEKVMNRGLAVLGALLIQLCLGAIYAWSVFTTVLKKEPFSFSATETQIIFSVGLGMFALLMPFAGKLQAKIGPRPVAFTGGILLGLGYILAGLFGHSFASLLVFIGIFGGAGIGLAYVNPIAVGMRWFPDMRGLITGIAVAGFGFGALLWVQLAGAWGHLLDSIGILRTFLYYGVTFIILISIGSIFMVYPPKGWRPKGWDPTAPKKGGRPIEQAVEMCSSDMLKTSQCYSIWLAYAFCALAGLMVIGIAKLFGSDALASSGLAKYADPKAAAAAAGTAYAIFFSLANGFGRIGWGSIADGIGWKRSITIMAIVQGVAMAALYFLGGNYIALCVFFAIVGANFGGTLALFPVCTAGCFGTTNVGQNYGFMFTAYGVGGIVGPILAGIFKDMGAGKGVTAWMPPFMIAAVLCIIAAVIIVMLRTPAECKEAPAPAQK
jgi:MFS transporter, OFA family, oxalate/formate antiporter